jgi:uncharacterized protein YpmS
MGWRIMKKWMSEWGLWKILFFTLLAVNLVFAGILFYWMTRPIEDTASLDRLNQNKDMVSIPFSSNKEDLNRVINHYIEEEVADSPIDYDVLLTDNLELYGTLRAFGKDVQLKVLFEPYTTNNGNILLRHRSIQIGEMSLPATFVLNYINEKYKVPEWVTINPAKKTIYLSLREMDLKSGITVEAKKFDLRNDDIQMNLLVPVE